MDTVYESRKASDGCWEVVEFRVSDSGHKDRGEVIAVYPDEETANRFRDERNRATIQ